MINEKEPMVEVYLKKIVEQNKELISLLKMVVGNQMRSNTANTEDHKPILDKIESLTKRERQILELIMKGMLNKQIAYELTVSLSTIEAHRSSIMKKMGVKNVAQLTIEYMKFQSLIKY